MDEHIQSQLIKSRFLVFRVIKAPQQGDYRLAVANIGVTPSGSRAVLTLPRAIIFYKFLLIMSYRLGCYQASHMKSNVSFLINKQVISITLICMTYLSDKKYKLINTGNTQ